MKLSYAIILFIFMLIVSVFLVKKLFVKYVFNNKFKHMRKLNNLIFLLNNLKIDFVVNDKGCCDIQLEKLSSSWVTNDYLYSDSSVIADNPDFNPVMLNLIKKNSDILVDDQIAVPHSRGSSKAERAKNFVEEDALFFIDSVKKALNKEKFDCFSYKGNIYISDKYLKSLFAVYSAVKDLYTDDFIEFYDDLFLYIKEYIILDYLRPGKKFVQCIITLKQGTRRPKTLYLILRNLFEDSFIEQNALDIENIAMR